MKNIVKHSNDRIFLTLVVGVQTLILVAGTIWGLSHQTSYWLDEIFSVVLAQSDLPTQIDVLIHDVHPPLYPAVLSGWVFLFGPSEIATRSLSFLFTLGVLPAAWVWGKRAGTEAGLLFAFFLMSSILLFYYAQETRSYALLLTLSTWSLVLAATGERRWLFGVLAAMGLTHFFGTLVACLILGWVLVENTLQKHHKADIRTILATFTTGLVIVLWPTHYLLSGRGKAVLGGEFWIETHPVGTFLHAFIAGFSLLHGIFSQILHLVSLAGLTLIIMLITSLLLACKHMHKNLKHPQNHAFLLSVILFTMTTLIVFIISFHTPISTLRNFIVVVPMGAMMMSLLLLKPIQNPKRQTLGLSMVACFFLISSSQTLHTINMRTIPEQDWKTVGRMISEHRQNHPEASVHHFVTPLFPRMTQNLFSRQRAGFYTEDPASINMLFLEDVQNGVLQPGDLVQFGDPSQKNTTPCDNVLSQHLQNMEIPHEVFFTRQHAGCTNGWILILER